MENKTAAPEEDQMLPGQKITLEVASASLVKGFEREDSTDGFLHENGIDILIPENL